MSKVLFVRRCKSPEVIRLIVEAGDRLITEQEFAKITGLKRRTVQQRRYLGKAPAYFKLKDSGAVRYLLSDTCEYLSHSSNPE